MGSPKVVAVTTVFALSIIQMPLVLCEGFECEKLPVELCAFSVSSSGVRCILEKKYSPTSPQYECQSSGILAEKMTEWIESVECLESCGLQRKVVGLSSDDLKSNNLFTSKLCSDNCRNNCPNIIELYFNLAAGEGVYLPKICETIKKTGMGYGADAPTAVLSSLSLAATPQMSHGADAPTVLSSLSLAAAPQTSYGADAPTSLASLSLAATPPTSS